MNPTRNLIVLLGLAFCACIAGALLVSWEISPMVRAIHSAVFLGLTGSALFLIPWEKDPVDSGPARGSPAAMPSPDPRPVPVPGPGEGRDHDPVLVVDDDAACLESVVSILYRHNISCMAAGSGAAALAEIESGQLPSVLLLDIMMPGISGLDICRRLREGFAPSELPIIMMTGRLEKKALASAYEAGASDYITKPFSPAELVARVRCHRDLRQAYHTVQENLRLEMEIQLQREKNRFAFQAAEREGLEKLRYQLNPHFLFNALAAIRGAVFSDQQAAHEMVSHLSEFCRMTLVRGGDELMTIDGEMAIVSHYLAMEKMRYGDYMRVAVDISPDAGWISIPACIIQPLVENAIKYGSRTSPDTLDIRITAACRDQDRVEIGISNSGDWVSPQSADAGRSTGTGIKNVRARLARIYGSRFRWQRESGHGSVTISLLLPDHI